MDYKGSTSKTRISEKKAAKIIREAQKNVKKWYDYWSGNIDQFRNDRDFYNGTQWDPREIAYYQSKRIEPVVFNLLKPICRQIIGESKNMQPSISLVPTTPEAVKSKDNKLLQGLLRQIAYSSRSSQVWTTALANMIMGGYGAVGLYTDYESPTSSNQVIRLRLFKDPTMCGWDPNALDKDKTDGEFCFYYCFYDKDVFKQMWPKAQVETGPGFLASTRSFVNFQGIDQVVVLEYYRREYKNKTLVTLSNNKDFKVDVFSDEVDAVKADYLKAHTLSNVPLMQIPPLVEISSRTQRICKVRCYKLTSTEILEDSDWPIDRLPIAFGDCLSSYKDGKQQTESLIFAVRQPQKVYNYCMSNIVAQVNRVRRNNVYMTAKQMAGYEDVHQNPDRQQGALPYNSDPSVAGGIPLFAPQQIVPEQFFQLAMQAKEDIQAILGIYEANRGEMPNQSSGVAIGRTIMQANLTTTQVFQNLFDLQQSIGEMTLDLVPHIYDAERVVSIVDESGQQKSAIVNQVTDSGQVENDLSQACYKLEVTPVASFVLQNQLENDFMKEIAATIPGAAPLMGDIMASKIESSIKGQLVERLQTLVPPQVIAKENNLPPPPPAPNPQAQMMQAQIQKLMAEVESLKTTTALKVQQFQQDQYENEVETDIKLKQQQIDQANIVASATATQVKAAAELKKAYLDASTQHGLALLKGIQDRENKNVMH